MNKAPTHCDTIGVSQKWNPTVYANAESKPPIITCILSILDKGAASSFVRRNVPHSLLVDIILHGRLPSILDANMHPLSLQGTVVFRYSWLHITFALTSLCANRFRSRSSSKSRLWHAITNYLTWGSDHRTRGRNGNINFQLRPIFIPAVATTGREITRHSWWERPHATTISQRFGYRWHPGAQPNLGFCQHQVLQAGIHTSKIYIVWKELANLHKLNSSFQVIQNNYFPDC